MSNLEHYFENLLYHGEDVYGGINKQSLTSDVQDAVEVCAQYVIYSLFGNRKAFEKFIKDAPAADVVEVKHGNWIWQGSISEGCWVCSECKDKFYQGYGNENFCPNCGAKMDKKGGAE